MIRAIQGTPSAAPTPHRMRPTGQMITVAIISHSRSSGSRTPPFLRASHKENLSPMYPLHIPLHCQDQRDRAVLTRSIHQSRVPGSSIQPSKGGSCMAGRRATGMPWHLGHCTKQDWLHRRIRTRTPLESATERWVVHSYAVARQDRHPVD